MEFIRAVYFLKICLYFCKFMCYNPLDCTGGNIMKRKFLSIVFVMIISLAISVSALADIKPVGNLWDNPDNLVQNGGTYTTGSESGFVVVWEKPECNVDGGYIIVGNKLPVVITATFARVGDVPWGQVKVDMGLDENGEPTYYEGWVMMSDLLDSTGAPAYTPPAETEAVEATDAPETEAPTESPSHDGVVDVSNTYNNAIVYTCLAIAAGALALVAYVLIKHQALNKKGE